METVSEIKVVKARKLHRCSWCGGIINIGEKYQTATYKDDEIYVWKNHIRCMDIAQELKMFDECDGYGVTEEDFCEFIKDEYSNIMDKLEDETTPVPGFLEQLNFVCEHHNIINQP